MNQNSKATSLWGVIVITALIGAIIFSLLAAVPYIDQKNWLAGFASDGDVEWSTSACCLRGVERADPDGRVCHRGGRP